MGFWSAGSRTATALENEVVIPNRTKQWADVAYRTRQSANVNSDAVAVLCREIDAETLPVICSHRSCWRHTQRFAVSSIQHNDHGRRRAVNLFGADKIFKSILSIRLNHNRLRDVDAI